MGVWHPSRSLHIYQWFTICIFLGAGLDLDCIFAVLLDGRLASIQELAYLLVFRCSYSLKAGGWENQDSVDPDYLRKEMQRIQTVAALRETISIELNLPTRAVIPNECVLALAKKPVETVEQLASMKGFPRNMATRFGNKILQAILNIHRYK